MYRHEKNDSGWGVNVCGLLRTVGFPSEYAGALCALYIRSELGTIYQ